MVDEPMTPDERAAKAAYDAMLRRPWSAEIREQVLRGEHEWDKQPEQLHDDWIAAIRAAVAEEREACAELAESVDSGDHIEGYENGNEVASEMATIIAAAIRNRGATDGR